MSPRQDAVFAGSLSKLWKSFRRRTQALDQVTLRVPRGAAFGLLGPNGAGKTTFVKILTGAVRPSSGMATLFGHPAGSREAARMLGYVPESSSAPLHLTAAQLLDFQSALYGVAAKDRRRRGAELLERVGLAEWASVPMSKYSRGMRQRACIAAALVHQPELLILDEPTDGLDPAGRREVLDLLRSLNRDQGVTLLINSHLLNEVEGLCGEVAMLNHGRLVRQGALENLRVSGGYSVTLSQVPGELVEALRIRGISGEHVGDCLWKLHLATRDQLDWTLDQARQSSARVEELVRSVNSLEQVYLAETQQEVSR